MLSLLLYSYCMYTDGTGGNPDFPRQPPPLTTPQAIAPAAQCGTVHLLYWSQISAAHQPNSIIAFSLTLLLLACAQILCIHHINETITIHVVFIPIYLTFYVCYMIRVKNHSLYLYLLIVIAISVVLISVITIFYIGY